MVASIEFIKDPNYVGLMTFELIQTSDGIHLNNTILWFHSKTYGKLSFLPSFDLWSPDIQSRILTSAETKSILTRGKSHKNWLEGQYNRPFSIGNLEFELIPAYDGFGGAHLKITHDHQSLLFLADLRESLEKTTPLAITGDIDCLAFPADIPLTPANQKIKLETYQAQLKELFTAALERPVFICDCSTYTAAHTILAAETFSVDLYAQRGDTAILRKLQKSGYWKTPVQPFLTLQKPPTKGLIFLSESALPSALTSLKEALVVFPYGGEIREKFFQNFFPQAHLHTTPLLFRDTAKDLVAITRQTKTKKVIFYGSYASDYQRYFVSRSSLQSLDFSVTQQASLF